MLHALIFRFELLFSIQEATTGNPVKPFQA